MGLNGWCPRCRRRIDDGRCPAHGSQPVLWRPEAGSYDAFAEHLRASAGFPTYLPWPMSPGWAVSDFGVVADGSGRPLATVTCCSGRTELDGRVDVFVVAEEAGVGLGGRCAGLPGADPGADFGHGSPAARIRIDSQAVRMWPVSTSGNAALDRSVVAGEAAGRWLWMVLLPASAMLLLRDDWILRDVSRLGPPLVEMPFAGPGPDW